MNFDFSYFIKVFPQIISYIPATLFMAILAMLVAALAGAIITLLKFSKSNVLNGFANVYISLFRGMPGLVQLFLIYYGLPQIFPSLRGMPAVIAVIIGLGFKQSAYLAEIFRAAVTSVDHGQIEAGQSLNISGTKIFLHILVPQAFVNALPATGNVFISIVKETSLAFALGITEIFAEGKMIAGESFRYFETYLAVGIVYWALIIIYTFLQKAVEKHISKPYIS